MWPLRLALARFRPANAATATRVSLVAAIFALFLVADFALFRKLFELIAGIEAATPFFAIGLLESILGLLFLVATMTLLFSAMTTSIGSLFNDLSLELYHSSPTTPLAIALRRWTATLIQSSWLVFFFLLPPIVALGIQYSAGPAFVLMTTIELLVLLTIPVSLAAILIVVLVRFFPVRHVQQIAATLGIIVVSLAVIGFRLARPERLFGDIQTDELRVVLETITFPEAQRWPGHWLASSIEGRLLSGSSWRFDYDLLVLALLLFIAYGVISWRVYFDAWVRARETSSPQMIGASPISRGFDRLAQRLKPATRAILGKELKVVTRDAAQWSQLMMMAALLIIYLYNIQMMPLEGDARAAILAWLNLGMSGFVIAAICLRFAYPSLTAEGRQFWLIRSSPLSMRRLLWVKAVAYAAPLTVLALLLTVFANTLLDASPLIWGYTIPSSIVITFTLVALGVGMGARNPRLDSDNPLEVALSLGGFGYMAISLLYVGLMMVLFARPMQRFVLKIVFGKETDGSLTAVVIPIVAALVISLVLTILPIESSARRLGRT